MSLIARVPALAPFRIRSFRFQWPADLLASWAFEMEGVILGWFVLVATESVLALAVFGSLQFLGTLISPLFGMAGDRFGYRNLLCLMRATYVAVALALMVLFLTGLASPVPVFVLATVIGLVRPSDITLRNLLVGETMPADYLMRAMGVSRTTADSARVVGALSGAALVAALGSGLAYVAVCAVYATSLALTFGVGIKRVRVIGEAPIHGSPLQSLKESFAYVWSTPVVRAVMLLAFLVNFAAYPLVGSLLAYVARDIYGLDQTGLGWLLASFAGGALLGSIVVSTHGARIRPARTMIACTLAWFTFNLAFSWVEQALLGEAILFAAGLVQSFCMVPMAVIILRVTEPAFRGRVMGVRMLAVYGLPVGLLLSGPLVEHAGFAATGSLYSLLGIGFTLLIAVRWRAELWHATAPANVR
ncbi:MAG: MFS transporter [Reyranella sp.]|uniref:MFS transporter n=1 Tax=Reyranella sp. TaxID=1929291 RepID=UPI002731AEC0|nr:MFS transporter [Reyranella sp.]MDP1965823.1 MFS transporter [Reyranella sp.]MDP2374993.1 MFS transporter [Reyranella sp.]